MSEEQLKPEEVTRVAAALAIAKQQTPQPNPEVEKLRADMQAMMKMFQESNQQLQEQNATLTAQIKFATIAAQTQAQAAPNIPKLPADLKQGQTVTYVNHAGRPEHAEVSEISESTGTVHLKVYGKHENDVQNVIDVKHGDKITRNSFHLGEPPAKPVPSLPKQHAKGLQVPNGA
jgi:hypothetical protein